jgi:hypothetical protein
VVIETTVDLQDPILRAARAYVLMLTSVFASALVPEKWRWRNHPDSKIIITGDYPVDASKTEKRPLIVVAPQQMAFVGVGLRKVIERGLLDENPTEIQDVLQGQFHISCIAKSTSTARQIAWIAAYMLRRNVEVLSRYGHFHEVEGSIVIGSQAKAGEYLTGADDDGWVRVPISSMFTMPIHAESTGGGENFHIVAQQIRMTLEEELGAQEPTPVRAEGILEAVRDGTMTYAPAAIDTRPILRSPPRGSDQTRKRRVDALVTGAKRSQT